MTEKVAAEVGEDATDEGHKVNFFPSMKAVTQAINQVAKTTE